MSGKNMLMLIATGALLLAGCSSPALTGIKVHIQNGDYPRAIHLADSVLAGPEAGNAEVWYWKGRAHSLTHDWENSAMAFEQAFLLDPSRAHDIADFWSVFFNAANHRYSQEDLQGAMSMLHSGQSIAPDRPEFPQMMGDLYLNEGDVPQAVDLFEEAFGLGTVLVGSIENELAAERDPARLEYLENEYYRVLSGAVLSCYNSARILENLYLNSDDPQEKEGYASRALGIIDRGLLLDPMNPDLLETKAEVLLIQGFYDQALQVYNDTEQSILQGEAEGWLTPEESREMRGALMLTRGFAYLEMERYEEALAELEGSRNLIGDNHDILATMAHANVLLERYEASLTLLDRALALEGLTVAQMANLHYFRFVNLSRLERDQASLEAIQTAIQYDSENPLYYDMLASTYSRLGRRQQAIQAMEHAERLRRQQQ